MQYSIRPILTVLSRFFNRIVQQRRDCGDSGVATTTPSVPLALLHFAIGTYPDNGLRRSAIRMQGGSSVASCDGYELDSNSGFVTPPIALRSEHRIYLTFGMPEAKLTDSLTLEISRDQEANTWTELARFRGDGSAAVGYQQWSISVKGWAGSERKVRVALSGSAQCFLLDLKVCTPFEVGRLNALSNYDTRMRNEVANFSGVAYTHAMYGKQGEQGQRHSTVKRAESQTCIATDLTPLKIQAHQRLQTLTPSVDEVAFNYAMRALGSLLPISPPDFFERARQLSLTKPLRILSICAGAARIEEQIINHCQGAIEIVLLDASPDLIGRAADRLTDGQRHCHAQCLIGDINLGLPGEGQFDLIVCVSALHHVANLEVVIGQINERLTEDGEFWSIGEQIGRNGNRLWPDALAAANQALMELPARLRRNAHTSQIDEELSDRDYSSGCFEGIRSEELEEILERFLIPHHVYKRNAFLWRLVDATYSDNFNLSDEADLQYLRELVVAEALHWVQGGRATELHGVYKKKFLR